MKARLIATPSDTLTTTQLKAATAVCRLQERKVNVATALGRMKKSLEAISCLGDMLSILETKLIFL